jgi:hypothetical protein
VKSLSEPVQCGSEEPVNREVCYSYGERSYNWWKWTEWISVKSDCKERGMAMAL